MESRTATVRAKIEAAHELTDPLTGILSNARDELDDAIGVLADAVDAEERRVEDLDLTAETAADRVTLRTARARLESLEELRNQLEKLQSAVDQAHTYVEEAEGLHDASIDALNEITGQ